MAFLIMWPQCLKGQRLQTTTVKTSTATICGMRPVEDIISSGMWTQGYEGVCCALGQICSHLWNCAHMWHACVLTLDLINTVLLWCQHDVADLTPQLVCFCHFSFQAVHSAEQTARGGVQGASGEPGAGEVEGVCRAADAQGSTSALPEGAWGSGAMGALFAWAVCGHPGTRNTSDHISPGKLLETGTRCWIVVRSNDN